MNIWECLKIQILLIIKTKLSGDWILTSLEEMSKVRFSVVLTFPHINFLLAALDNNKYYTTSFLQCRPFHDALQAAQEKCVKFILVSKSCM